MSTPIGKHSTTREQSCRGVQSLLRPGTSLSAGFFAEHFRRGGNDGAIPGAIEVDLSRAGMQPPRSSTTHIGAC